MVIDFWKNKCLANLSKEKWCPIKEFPGYEISNYGRVKSKCRIKHRILSQNPSHSGYCQVGLSKGRKIHTKRVHKLVALAFIDNPENKPFINHKEGNKTDNRHFMLEWCTSSENMQHSVQTGLYNPTSGIKHGMSKLSEKDVMDIFNSTINATILAKKYEISTAAISNIKRGKAWTHITHKKFNYRFLSEEKVLQIFNEKLPYIQIAKLYNIAPCTVSFIKRGISYSKYTGKCYSKTD